MIRSHRTTLRDHRFRTRTSMLLWSQLTASSILYSYIPMSAASGLRAIVQLQCNGTSAELVQPLEGAPLFQSQCCVRNPVQTISRRQAWYTTASIGSSNWNLRKSMTKQNGAIGTMLHKVRVA